VDPRAALDHMEKRKFLTLPGLELKPLSRPARSQSLYRLRYPGSWYSFLLEAESTQGHSASGRIRSIEKIHVIGIGTRDVPPCSIVPQPTYATACPSL
jgi:hypothetical protein